jgi:hypothetical protein
VISQLLCTLIELLGKIVQYLVDFHLSFIWCIRQRFKFFQLINEFVVQHVLELKVSLNLINKVIKNHANAVTRLNECSNRYFPVISVDQSVLDFAFFKIADTVAGSFGVSILFFFHQEYEMQILPCVLGETTHQLLVIFNPICV